MIIGMFIVCLIGIVVCFISFWLLCLKKYNKIERRRNKHHNRPKPPLNYDSDELDTSIPPEECVHLKIKRVKCQ